MANSDPVAKHAFNAACDTTLDRCQGIGAQRGGEYLDSWAVENQVTTFLNHVLALPVLKGREREYKRLLMVAALCDVKDSRMSGPWKTDTVDDGINYRAAFASWRDEYEAYRKAATWPSDAEDRPKSEGWKCKGWACPRFGANLVCCEGPNGYHDAAGANV